MTPELPVLRVVFGRLLDCFGPQHWWPAESPFEMMVGAVLTQNTAWRNVELSIAALRRAGALRPQTLYALSDQQLQDLIRSSGFFQRKSHCLKRLSEEICYHYQGRLELFLDGELPVLRQRLLTLAGIGPETADCIVLYAAGLPIFVVDAYTRRIFSRLGLLDANSSYDLIQRYAMSVFPSDCQLFNEFHALIVALAKRNCLSRLPKCATCPLLELCLYGQSDRNLNV